MLRGLDVSSVQGLVDFKSLGPGYRFVILKAQQGNDGFDPRFVDNMYAAIDAGLEVFAYCFTYPLPHLDPVEQAKLFVDRVYRYPALRGRPIFHDLEWPEVVARPPAILKGWKEWGCSPPQLADWLRRHVEAGAVAADRAPCLYLYDWWISAIRDGAPAYGFHEPGDVSWMADYDLWMAWYVKSWPQSGDSPKIPRPFKTWRFWQWDGNDGLRLPNSHDADFCVFNGTEDDLQAWIRNELVSPSTPPVELNTARGIQGRLAALGFDPGPVDGVRGLKTDLAIRAFQRSRGLAPDGIIGPKTRAALAL